MGKSLMQRTRCAGVLGIWCLFVAAAVSAQVIIDGGGAGGGGGAVPITAAQANPTVNDDISLGFTVGWIWVNTFIAPPRLFILLDNTDGAAVWQESDTTASQTLDQAFDLGKSIDGANSLTNAACIHDATGSQRCFYTDGAGSAFSRTCNQAKTVCTTAAVRMEAGSDWDWLNESGTACYSIDSVTGILSPSSSGTCTPNIARTSAVGAKSITTNPYTMLASDCGKMLWIETGAGEIDLLTDPTNGASPAGCLVCFYTVNAVALLLDPDNIDTIDTIDASAAGLTLAAGDRLGVDIVTPTAGAQLCLMGYSATLWRALVGTGVLSDEN